MLPDVLYHNNPDLPRFAWWGHNKERRFKMEPVFDPAREPKAGKSVIYQYFLAPYLASVEMFDEIGMDANREKR
jgi:kynureninase